MKKTLYMFLSALLAVSLFAGCSDDDDNNITFTDTASNDAAGVYTGTFYRTQQGLENAETSEAQGTMTITAVDKYTATIAYSCSELSINHSCIVNITHSNKGFAFSNHVKSNALGAAFLGRVDDDKNVESHLTLNIVSGRGAKVYSIVFKGKKQ